MDALKRVSLIAIVLALLIVGAHTLVFPHHPIDGGVLAMASCLGGLPAVAIEWILRRREGKAANSPAASARPAPQANNEAGP